MEISIYTKLGILFKRITGINDISLMRKNLHKRIGMIIYKKLTLNAKQEYEKVRRQYASMADASTNVSLKSVELRMEDLENDMQLKFNTYTNLNNQLQAAKAKVQERTPVFTILKGAAVPIKPAGPKLLHLLHCFGRYARTPMKHTIYRTNANAGTFCNILDSNLSSVHILCKGTNK